ELGQRCWGTSSLPRVEDVAPVAKVFPSHLAVEESGCRQIAEAIEDRYTLAQIRPRFRGTDNVIEHLLPLRVGRANERSPESLLALDIQPAESTAHRDLARIRGFLVRQKKIHVLRNLGVGRAA